jgi:hypothetical protein
MEAAKTTERLRHVKQGVDVDRGGDKEAMREVGQGAQSASRENTEELEDAESGSAEEVSGKVARCMEKENGTGKTKGEERGRNRRFSISQRKSWAWCGFLTRRMGGRGQGRARIVCVKGDFYEQLGKHIDMYSSKCNRV